MTHEHNIQYLKRYASEPSALNFLRLKLCDRYLRSVFIFRQIWPRDATAALPSLVANPGTNYVSSGGFGVPLSEWTCTTVPCWWPSPGGGGRVTATAVFGGDCGTDRPSHGAFYDRRSRFFCCCRSGVEQPSALGDVISVPSGFPKDSFIYSVLPAIATLF